MTRPIWLADRAEQVDPYHSAEKRHQAWVECWRKERFYSQGEANHALRNVQRRNDLRGDSSHPVHVYQCRYEELGRHWHIGHVSARYQKEES